MQSAKELQRRAAANSLPLADDGNLDTERIALALEDATGIIVAQLPWLLKDGDVVETVPAQFDSALRSICADIAIHRLTDAVTSSEDARAWYADSIKLLEKIDREYKGGLSGPDLQERQSFPEAEMMIRQTRATGKKENCCERRVCFKRHKRIGRACGNLKAFGSFCFR